MPRQLITDVHEWINEISIFPTCGSANQQPRERAWQFLRGKKTLLSLTLVCLCEVILGVQSRWEASAEIETPLPRILFCLSIWKRSVERRDFRIAAISTGIAYFGLRHLHMGSLAGAARVRHDSERVQSIAQRGRKPLVE